MNQGTQAAFECLLSVGHTSVWLLEPQELTRNDINNNHEMGLQRCSLLTLAA